MKSICIIIVAAIVLFGIATHSMHRNQANPYADQIIGSWETLRQKSYLFSLMVLVTHTC